MPAGRNCSGAWASRSEAMSDASISRRDFLSAGSSALAWPAALSACATRIANSQDPWSTVRAEFLIPADRIYLNVGTLGPQPRVVLDAVIEHSRRVAMSLPPGVDWDTLKQA